eukprot:768583-Hanusia_phi.AAC.6
MEVDPQVQLGWLRAVPGPQQHAASSSCAVQRRLQPPWVPRHLDGEVDVHALLLEFSWGHHSPDPHPASYCGSSSIELYRHDMVGADGLHEDGADQKADDALPEDSHLLPNDRASILHQR